MAQLQAVRQHDHADADRQVVEVRADPEMPVVDGLAQGFGDPDRQFLGDVLQEDAELVAEQPGGDQAQQAAVQKVEDKIRADIDQLVEARRVKVEADLRAEGQAIADRLRAPVEARLRTEINAYATNLAKGYKPEQMGEFQAALQPYIDSKVEAAKAEVTKLVEAELASRIAGSKADRKSTRLNSSH